MSKANPVRRVAILGGGCGALSAAWWLTATPALRARHQVTVYCQGWRLGGKGASGRDADQHERIVEHGLHMMMGFYEVVFRTLRDCYAELAPGPDQAFRSWTDAFEPQRQVTLWLRPPQDDAPGPWQPWNLQFPQLPGTPGDGPLPLRADAEFQHKALAGVLDHLLHHSLAQAEQHISQGPIGETLRRLREALSAAVERLAEVAEAGARDALVLLLEGAQALFVKWIAPHLRVAMSPLGYKLWLVIDLALAGSIGLLRDVLPHGANGWARIDDRDFKDWLVEHGASAEAARSPVILCLYDLAFAYPGGASSDPAQGRAAAGAMLHLLLRMSLGYRDAPLWKMRAGMGDAIFTPLYRVLEARGVRFEFFSRVEALRLSSDCLQIERIELAQQARVLRGPYQPLRNVRFADGRSWPCWPDQPRWEQLEDGAALRDAGTDFEDPWTPTRVAERCLKLGEHFDDVVLAIPPDAAAPLTADLRTHAGWAAMLDHAASVPTVSCQLWLRPTLEQLGWTHGQTVATCYVSALQSWASMDQVLPAENWPAPGAPQSCAYFCGSFEADRAPPPGTDAPTYLPSQNRLAEDLSRTWLAQHLGPMWPQAIDTNGGLNPSLVVSAYFRGNVQWSERYVLSLPGSLSFRLDPADSGFANLYLAGDWTVTSINGGCAEAAFESGLRAALGIRGEHPGT